MFTSSYLRVGREDSIRRWLRLSQQWLRGRQLGTLEISTFVPPMEFYAPSNQGQEWKEWEHQENEQVLPPAQFEPFPLEMQIHGLEVYP